MNILITGGSGFIGSNLIRHILKNTEYQVINVDKLTYAGNLDSLNEFNGFDSYIFELADICNEKKMSELIDTYQPDKIMHLAAESHVDRSIDSPIDFINTNIVGTYVLLEVSKKYWMKLDDDKKNKFRFHHISTDEVYGSLAEGDLFTESSPYKPSSPYSASKSSSDHLVRAWYRTYGLPVITTDTNQTSCYTERGINGFIVKSNNIEDLSKKLESLINNKDKLKKFGNKNFNIVKKKYNPEVIYKKYFETILKP